MKINSFILHTIGSLLTMLFLIVFNPALGQKVQSLTLEWGTPQLLTEGSQSIEVPVVIGHQMDGDRPNFFWRQPITTAGNPDLSLALTGTELALPKEVAYLEKRGINVDKISYYLTVSKARSERHAVLNMFPFVKIGSQIHRITSVEITFKKNTALPGIKKSFATSSVLNSGSGIWIKISVIEDGVHKIDKTFLRTHLEPLGVDVDNLNPAHIHIYGNGDGRLPELNSTPRTDDLAENAIEIIGEADGVFDETDYILFYGWGPDRMYANGTAELYVDRNPYSKVSCYFININAEVPPLRILSTPSSLNPITHNLTSYSYFSKYESDLVSLVKGGQRWYGELFDSQMSYSFPFNVQDIDASSPASFKVSLASNASGSGNTHSYVVNGASAGSGSITSAPSDFVISSLNFNAPSVVSLMNVQMTVVRNSPDILTYLDYLSLNARRNLTWAGSSYNFRDLSSVGVGNVAEYTLSGLPAATGFVWDVTDRHTPGNIAGSFIGANYVFASDADTLREFVGSDGISFLTPLFVENVAHQNLHILPQADYLIITHPAFITSAKRLADLHRADGLTVHVATTDQVYNEFSSGMKDATAIRMFAKMFYDRGALAPQTQPNYLLLFGDGTFDHRNILSSQNYVQTYQVANSENHIRALVTDDYFGLLDDSESISPNDEMDIGVGRLLISSTEIAKQQVDKIEHYMLNGSSLYSTANTNCSADGGSTTYGDWRTKCVLIADDEENGYFIVNDCEPAYEHMTDSFPSMNVDKLYLDAFQQVSTAGGQRYPDVVDKINDRIERGALVINYVGHGGEVGVAEERVITVPQIQDWKNIDRLTLLVSATCEFTKYDDPDRVSAGEWASLNPYGGAIALMTTTRSVFFGVNTLTIEKFTERVFARDTLHQPLTFGEIMRTTKNASGSSENKRSFTLIGDPALQIALPIMNVLTDSINGLSPSVEIDTISALSTVTIKGHIEDFDANILTGFNGILYPSVLDKPKVQQTLGNDPASPIISFEIQNNKLYRGKVSVVNGYFEFSFVVPKDIDYSFDFGKISYYAENAIMDALGDEKRIIIGGIDPIGINDSEGPQIDLFLNENTFVSGGISDETPILIAKLFDQNGINTVGNGIGHDLVAVLDGETGSPIVLNDYYTADLDSYQSGEIRYNFGTLDPGPHTLSVKVWDVNNNSSDASIDFIVMEKETVSLDHVLNYPNPFTTSTTFYFEHNQACVDLETQIQIFTVSGRLVKTINESVQCDGFRSKGIPWNGRDDFGDQLAKGVYIYRVKVKTPDGIMAEKTEKLVILK
ncbi:MAG: hypothetical protein ACI837_000422 [Crocinitomicaceae bacterium]|jgi:hypothetical protein